MFIFQRSLLPPIAGLLTAFALVFALTLFDARHKAAEDSSKPLLAAELPPQSQR